MDDDGDARKGDTGHAVDRGQYMAALRVRVNNPEDPDHEREQVITVTLHRDFRALHSGPERKGASGIKGTELQEAEDDHGGGIDKHSAIVFHLFHNKDSTTTTTWRVSHDHHVAPASSNWDWWVEGEDGTGGKPARDGTIDVISDVPDTNWGGDKVLDWEVNDHEYDGGIHVDSTLPSGDPEAQEGLDQQRNYDRENGMIIRMLIILTTCTIFVWVPLIYIYRNGLWGDNVGNLGGILRMKTFETAHVICSFFRQFIRNLRQWARLLWKF
ncbi:hypothetical protein F4677DRAFT_464164 [Hypoxylon crocopeplum]|nr:hypothetical protein F4677DRAFT_464164 [Hypoxylon crocopeplum]